ncbi:hypothetical protein GCM10027048_34270 [Hymenobacter coalescens]
MSYSIAYAHEYSPRNAPTGRWPWLPGLLLACWLSSPISTTQVAPPINVQVGPCSFASTVKVLGTPTATTVISGNTAFSGPYHVVGELLLENGYFDVRPGTVLYVDGYGRSSPARHVNGLRIRLGKNATLHAEQAIFRAACKTGQQQAVLNLRGLPAGPYACTLVMSGHPMSVQRLQVSHD